MKHKLTSLYVDDQDKALALYTEVLALPRRRFQSGPFSRADRGVPRAGRHSVQLGRNDNPAAKALSAGEVSNRAARGMFYTGRRQGRLRADQGPRGELRCRPRRGPPRICDC